MYFTLSESGRPRIYQFWSDRMNKYVLLDHLRYHARTMNDRGRWLAIAGALSRVMNHTVYVDDLKLWLRREHKLSDIEINDVLDTLERAYNFHHPLSRYRYKEMLLRRKREACMA